MKWLSNHADGDTVGLVTLTIRRCKRIVSWVASFLSVVTCVGCGAPRQESLIDILESKSIVRISVKAHVDGGVADVREPNAINRIATALLKAEKVQRAIDDGIHVYPILVIETNSKFYLFSATYPVAGVHLNKAIEFDSEFLFFDGQEIRRCSENPFRGIANSFAQMENVPISAKQVVDEILGTKDSE